MLAAIDDNRHIRRGWKTTLPLEAIKRKESGNFVPGGQVVGQLLDVARRKTIATFPHLNSLAIQLVTRPPQFEINLHIT